MLLVVLAALHTVTATLDAAQCQALLDISTLSTAGLRPFTCGSVCGDPLSGVVCCDGDTAVCELHWSGVHLSGDVPASVAAFVNLTLVDFSDNDLTFVPDALFELPALQEFTFDDNKLSGPLPLVPVGLAGSFRGNNLSCPYPLAQVCLYAIDLDPCVPPNMFVDGSFTPIRMYTREYNSTASTLELVWARQSGTVDVAGAHFMLYVAPLGVSYTPDECPGSVSRWCMAVETSETDALTGATLYTCRVADVPAGVTVLGVAASFSNQTGHIVGYDMPRQHYDWDLKLFLMLQTVGNTPPLDPPVATVLYAESDTVTVGLWPFLGVFGGSPVSSTTLSVHFVPEESVAVQGVSSAGSTEVTRMDVSETAVATAASLPVMVELPVSAVPSGRRLVVVVVANNEFGAGTAGLMFNVEPCSAAGLALPCGVVNSSSDVVTAALAAPVVGAHKYLEPSLGCLGCPRPHSCSGALECNPGNEGPLCSVCASGYSANGDPSDRCVECSVIASVTGTLGLCGLLVGTLIVLRKRQPSVMWGIVQVVFHSAQVMRIVAKQVESRVGLRSFSGLRLLEFNGFFNIRCLFGDSVDAFWFNWVTIGCVLPVACLVTIAVTSRKLRQGSKQEGPPEDTAAPSSPSSAGLPDSDGEGAEEVRPAAVSKPKPTTKSTKSKAVNPPRPRLGDLAGKTHTPLFVVATKLHRFAVTLLIFASVDLVKMHMMPFLCFWDPVSSTHLMSASPSLECWTGAHLGVVSTSCVVLLAIVVCTVQTYLKLQSILKAGQMNEAPTARVYGVLTWMFQPSKFSFAVIVLGRKMIAYALGSSGMDINAQATLVTGVNLAYLLLLLRHRPYVAFLRRFRGRTWDILNLADLVLAAVLVLAGVFVSVPGLFRDALLVLVGLATLPAIVMVTFLVGVVVWSHRMAKYTDASLNTSVNMAAVGAELRKEIQRVHRILAYIIVKKRDLPLALECKLQLDSLRRRHVDLHGVMAATSIRPGVSESVGGASKRSAWWGLSVLGSVVQRKRRLSAVAPAVKPLGSSTGQSPRSQSTTSRPETRGLQMPGVLRESRGTPFGGMEHGLRPTWSFYEDERAAPMVHQLSSLSSVEPVEDSGTVQKAPPAVDESLEVTQADLDTAGLAAQEVLNTLWAQCRRGGMASVEALTPHVHAGLAKVNSALQRLLIKVAEAEDLEVLSMEGLSLNAHVVLLHTTLSSATSSLQEHNDAMAALCVGGDPETYVAEMRKLEARGAALSEFAAALLDTVTMGMDVKDLHKTAAEVAALRQELDKASVGSRWRVHTVEAVSAVLPTVSQDIWEEARTGGHPQLPVDVDRTSSVLSEVRMCLGRAKEYCDEDTSQGAVQACREACDHLQVLHNAVPGCEAGGLPGRLTAKRVELRRHAATARQLRVFAWVGALVLSGVVVAVLVGTRASGEDGTSSEAGGSIEDIVNCAPLANMSLCSDVALAQVGPGSLYDAARPVESTNEHLFLDWLDLVTVHLALLTGNADTDEVACRANLFPNTCSLYTAPCEDLCPGMRLCQADCQTDMLPCWGVSTWEDSLTYQALLLDNLSPGGAFYSFTLSSVGDSAGVQYVEAALDLLMCRNTYFDDTPSCSPNTTCVA